MKTEVIRVEVLPNGRYDYNEEDVYKFLNKDVKRKTQKIKEVLEDGGK